MAASRTTKGIAVALAALALAVFGNLDLRADVPWVAFDVPFTVECRDVTPKEHAKAYQKKLIEAVLKISPQLLAGEERDLKRLHYEISTEDQMPVVGFLPDSQVGTDVAGGAIAIQTSSHHGNLSVRYLVLPATGNGEIKGDLESSHAQYTLLAPRQLLLATGTIQRGCGVFFDLRPSTQDTLQKPREFACLFEVPKEWRADYLTVRCAARGMKRGLGGLLDSEVSCGSGLLCVGLYTKGDGEARALADELAKKQQRYLDRLAREAKTAKGKTEKLWPKGLLGSFERLTSDPVMKAKQADLSLGATVEAELEGNKGLRDHLPPDSRTAGRELDAAKETLRKMNGK